MSWRERRKKEERETNAIYSGHLRFCLQPKGSARTPLGPIIVCDERSMFDGMVYSLQTLHKYTVLFNLAIATVLYLPWLVGTFKLNFSWTGE